MKLFWLLSSVLCAPAFAGVVTVSSIYQDLSDANRRLEVKGSGALVSYQNRQFVITASHVSQGSEAKIKIGSKELAIVGRMLHGNSDLELFEVQGADAGEILGVHDGVGFVFDETRIARKRWIDRYNFVALNDWVSDPNLQADNAFGHNRSSQLSTDWLGYLLHADAIVQPGTSGAPLLTTVPTAWTESLLPYGVYEGLAGATPGKTYLRGVAIRRDRFFARASFVAVGRVYNLITAYLKKQPMDVITKWQASGPLLFRSTDEYQETSGLSSATAGGTITDVGNGVIMEGGDLATLGEDTPNEFLEKVSTFPVSKGEPIMAWAIAMRHPKTSAFINFWSWFDMELYPALQRFQWSFSTEQSGPDIVRQLGPRFGKTSPFEISMNGSSVRVDASGAYFNLLLEDGDHIEFMVDRQGRYCAAACRPRFQPVIEVGSLRGTVYLVDVREVFYIDLANMPMAVMRTPGLEGKPHEEILNLVYDEVMLEAGHPRIHYRLKKADPNAPLTTQQGVRKTIRWY